MSNQEINDPKYIAEVKRIAGQTPKEIENMFWQESVNGGGGGWHASMNKLPQELKMAMCNELTVKINDPVKNAKAKEGLVRQEIIAPPVVRLVAPTVVMQAGSRGVQRQGLHTPTMAEIIAQGNQRDPTVPYFDTNSDHMRQINPLEPHYDLSGDFPKLVNPLKPGLKINNLG